MLQHALLGFLSYLEESVMTFKIDQHGFNKTRWEGSHKSLLSKGNDAFKSTALVTSEFYMKLSEFHENFTWKEFYVKKWQSSLWEKLYPPNSTAWNKSAGSVGPWIHWDSPIILGLVYFSSVKLQVDGVHWMAAAIQLQWQFWKTNCSTQAKSPLP